MKIFFYGQKIPEWLFKCDASASAKFNSLIVLIFNGDVKFNLDDFKGPITLLCKVGYGFTIIPIFGKSYGKIEGYGVNDLNIDLLYNQIIVREHLLLLPVINYWLFRFKRFLCKLYKC